MTIFLIGYRGCGKSTIAPLVARGLGWASVDLDVEIEREAGRSIADIFEREGESGFRERESAALARFARNDRVLATGGGIVLLPSNRAILSRGFVAWLTASPDVIEQRLARDVALRQQRPKLTVGGREEIDQVLRERTPIYRGLARLTIATDRLGPEESAQMIIAGWRADRHRDQAAGAP